MSKCTDDLLYVISVKKEISWKEFKNNFEYLYHRHQNKNGDPNLIHKERKKLVHFLQALGHCEFDFSNSHGKVYVAPPVLVRLPIQDSYQAILAGARTPKTFDKLRDTCQNVDDRITVEINNQLAPILTPARISIQAQDVTQLQEIANQLGIYFSDNPAAWSILHFVGSLEKYLANLEWEESIDLTWNCRTFDPRLCQFKKKEKEINAEIHLTEYENPITQQKIYFLYQKEECAEVERDWGRYALFSKLGINVIFYDENSCKFAVPAGAKLPKLLERVLTLCSGYVQQQKQLQLDHTLIKNFDLYQDVPLSIAKKVAKKLGQILLRQSIIL